MTTQDEKPADKTSDALTPDDAEGEIALFGQTLIGPNGELRSSIARMRPTPALLDAILAEDIPEIHDVNASYRQSEELTRALLAIQQRAELPGPGDKPLPHHVHKAGEHAEHEGAEDFEEDYRPFIGGAMANKWNPGNLPAEGKDPMQLRTFIGDEFPRMLLYGPPKGKRVIEQDEHGNPRIGIQITEQSKPAFMSHWPKGTPLEEMKVIKVNLASRIPEYMKRGTIAAAMDARRDFSFEGQSLEEAFKPITSKIEKAWRRYAKDFEKTFGIRLDVRWDKSDTPHKEEEVNISVLGFEGGNPELAGFASFPPAVSEWPDLAGLGAEKGYMMLNSEYCNNALVTDDMLYDLILHEMGHFFGWVHPHDLGAMHMEPKETLSSTAMSYTDGKFTKFPGQEGVTAGIVEHYFRNFVAHPPEINTEHETVYDLGKQFSASGGANWNSQVAAITNLIPAVAIVNNGTGAVLRGTQGNDILDTEPGYASCVENPKKVKQRFALIEGHFAKVYGVTGDNEIFTSRKGSQEIYPGGGTNQIHIYDAGIGNDKTIFSRGNDTLVLHQDIFVRNEKLVIEQDGNDIIISNSTSGRIILKDQLKIEKDALRGISSINVINDEGRTVMEVDVTNFASLDDFKRDFLLPMRRRATRILKKEKAEAAEALAAQNPSPPAAPAAGNDNEGPEGFVAKEDRRKKEGQASARG